MPPGCKAPEGRIGEDPILPLARYRLRFKPARRHEAPVFSGSAWRGALGHALKKAVCVTDLDRCSPCLLYRSCPYPYVFETPPPLAARKMRKYTAAPHPFVLEPPPSSKEGHHEVGLVLIGRGNAHLAYMIHAFERAGHGGLGRRREPMTLVDVWQAETGSDGGWRRVYSPGAPLEARPPDAPPRPRPPSAARLRFETPVRLQRDGRLVTPETFRFSDLFGALLRRVSMLTYFHTDTPLETDFATLMERARRVDVTGVRLSWKEWTRYSSRQKTTMQMGGLVGEIGIGLEEDSPFWPYLWLGQWVHVGKGTSMGLGRYTIEPASLPDGESGGG